MLEVSNLTKYFGHFRAVNNLSFTAQKGDVVGFLGPNGAGKSTTMKMITGFIAPSQGQIRIAGYDSIKQPLLAKQKIGYLPEGAPAYDEMTPLQFLHFMAQMRGLSGKHRAQRIQAVIEHTQLKSVLSQPIATLSKGYKRRLGLAQAILHDPEILILDEPTDGLDPNQKQQVRQLITQMAHEKLIIVSTHILEEVSAVCNRAMIIAQGKKLVDETPMQLAARSKYCNAVSVTLQHDVSALQGLLSVDGVSAIEQHNTHTATVFAKPHHSIFESVTQFIRQHQLQIEQISIEAGRLEDVFQQLTQEVA